MISLPELLEDKLYRAYFQTIPKLPRAAYLPSTPPWRVLIRVKEGSWYSCYEKTYAAAFTTLKSYRLVLLDGAIISRRVQFPVFERVVRIKGKYVLVNGEKRQVTRATAWKPKLDPYETTHYWCPYCRRPTVFGYYKKHHAIPVSRIGVAVELDPSILRCAICAASERLVTLK